MAPKKTSTEAKVIRQSSGDGLVKMETHISQEVMKKVKGEVAKRNGMKKYASGLSVGPGTYYNPLYTPTSLQLPRDRKQINVWCRHFFETEALIGAVIDLYSSLPISDYSVECPNPTYRKYCEDMLTRLKTRTLLQGVALEYWKIGDCFIMGELDEEKKDWKRFVVLNPDQIEVKTNMLISEPYYEMIPDENLKRLVFDQEPKQQYNELKIYAPDVIQAVRAGKNIPVDAAHITHLKHLPTPYGTYGVPLMKRVFKTLMYKEMIRRAQFTIAERYVMPLKIFKLGSMDELPEQHEIDAMQEQLTNLMNDPSMILVTHARFAADWQGIAGKTLQLNGEYDFIEREIISGLGVSRAFIDGTGPCVSDDTEALTNKGFRKYSEINQAEDLLARFDDKTNKIEWVKPVDYHAQLYKGDMIHFKTGRIDKLVSPNHKMLVQFKKYKNKQYYWDSYEVKTAEELYDYVQSNNIGRNSFRIPATFDYESIQVPDSVEVAGENLPIEDYLKLLGYYVSEGCYRKQQYHPSGSVQTKMKLAISQEKKSKHWATMSAVMERQPDSFKVKYYGHEWLFSNPAVVEHFKSECYNSEIIHYSHTKSIPFWVKSLPKDLLHTLLMAACQGDGSSRAATKKKPSNKSYWTYVSTSTKLIGDLQEIAIKCGYATKVKPRKLQLKKDGSGFNRQTYALYISCGLTRDSKSITGLYPTINKKDQVAKVPYNGVIWCPDVGGSHFFVARRNGLVFVTQNTYANASIGGNAFLQKLENFRLTLKEFIEEKVFKPIAELNGWYDTDPDTDEEFLVVPEFKWDALRLQDEVSRQQTLMALRQGSMVSAKTVLDSIHINAETEAQNLMEERDTIFDANRIMARQMMIQMAMTSQMQAQQMAMQMKMMGGQDPTQMGLGNANQPPGIDVGGNGAANGQDLLSNLPGAGTGGGIEGIPPGAGFSPMQKATTRPPVAALKDEINDIKIKIQAILDEKE